MRLLLALVLCLLTAGVAVAQGPGFYIAMPGTGLSSCSAITGPVLGRTWCADGGALSWKVWNGSTYVTGGVGGLSSIGGQVGPSITLGNDTNITLNASGNVITPGWQSILAVGRGGTGVSSFTSTRIPIGAGSSALTTDALLTFNTSTKAFSAGRTLALSGSSSGSVTLGVPAAAGSTTITFPATTGTVVTSGDSGLVFSLGGPHWVGNPAQGSYTGVHADRHQYMITGQFNPAQTDTVLNPNGWNVNFFLQPDTTAPPGSGLANSTLVGSLIFPTLRTDTSGGHSIFGSWYIAAPQVVSRGAGVHPDYICSLCVEHSRPGDVANVGKWALWVLEGYSRFNDQAGFGNIVLPTAWVHLGAGTSTASTAPLKFTSGTNLTTPEVGAVEFNGTTWYGTVTGPTRKTFAFLESPTLQTPTFVDPVLGRAVGLSLVIGAPTGGYKGDGTVNIEDKIFINGVGGAGATLNVRSQGGGSDCQIVVAGGIITSSTCP